MFPKINTALSAIMTMRKNRLKGQRMKATFFATARFAMGLAAPVAAAPVQWSSGVGGNDHWYDVITVGSAIKWTDANASATSMTHLGESGYLASITSAAELTFVNALNAALPPFFGTYVESWFGGTDAASEGTWTWSLGETFVPYTNWNTGEPNNLFK